MADDKDEAIPDPWAGLEGAGEGDAQDEFAFSFDGVETDATVEEETAAVIEDSSDDQRGGGLEAFAVEAVVEDEIAGWLEPAANGTDAAAASESSAELGFAESIFTAASPDEQEETAGAVVSFPVVRDNPEEDEQAETLLFANGAARLGDGEHDATDGDAMTFEGGGLDVVESAEAVAELESDDADPEPAAVLAIGGSQAARVASKPKAKKKSGPGFLGPVLGGLLSLPIVFSILLGLLWGTGRDPIGMRSWLPSFLLPARNGATGVAAAVVANAKPPSLDDLAKSESAAAPDVAAEPPPSTPESPLDPAPMVNAISAPSIEAPQIEDPLLAATPVVPSIPAAEPAAAMPPASPPLDRSGLEAAVSDALASMDVVAGIQDGEPAERRRALVAWYKNLARVGTEMATLETAAADTGRPLDETPEPVATLYDRLGSAGVLAADLKRLCRNWVDYAKRPADGVLLVGVLDAARQVGPFWYTTLSLEQVDGSMRTVSLISRREPRADSGDRVAVAGVVFSEDTVWAADCGRLGAAAAHEDDPF
jgi:hypothetical protein